MADVVLFGTGRGARVAHRLLTADSPHKVCAFTVDEDFLQSSTFMGLPVVAFEKLQDEYPPSRYEMLILMGYNKMNAVRQEKYATAKNMGYRCVSYVSSHFLLWDDIEIGENCVILDNQSISLDVKIGNNVVMWSSNHIGDNTVIEDDVWVSSHVSVAANAVLGRGSFFGMNATVGNHVSIGANAFIGADALVSSDIPSEQVVLSQQGTIENITARQFMRSMIAQRKL